MAVELDGRVIMRGDTGPGVGVKVLAEAGHLQLVSGTELVGDWAVADIGMNAGQDGFSVRAEGEEFLLHTTEDAALAEELGVVAASPRMARRIAVRHNPEEQADVSSEPPQISSNLAAIGFAVAGALIAAGGSFLKVTGQAGIGAFLFGDSDGLEFWLVFLIGGVLMIAVAYAMSMGMTAAHVTGAVVLAAVIAGFGLAVSRTDPGAGDLSGYGFIAGGVVVGVAVLAGGGLRPRGSTDH